MTTHRYSCRAVRNMLPLHVGRDLDPRHVPAVDEHLRRCLSCFREFRDLGAVRGRLGVLAEEPLPAGVLDGFVDEVMARIAVGEPGPAAPVLRLQRSWWNRPALMGAAALLLVSVAAWRWFDGLPVAPRSPAGDGSPGVVARGEPLPDELPSLPRKPRMLAAPLAFPMGRAQRAASAGEGELVSGGQAPASKGRIFLFPGTRLPSPSDALLIEQGGEAMRAILPVAPAPEGLELDESGRERRLRRP